MTGVMKAQLFELEKQAGTLERIVLKDLTKLEWLELGDSEQVEAYERRILRKLHKLDEIQDDIDAVVTRLKELGALDPVSTSANIYEYKPPTPHRVAFEVRKNADTGAERARPKTSWDSFSALLEEGEEFTSRDISTKLDTIRAKCKAHIQHWRNKGYIEPAGMSGRAIIYRRVKPAEKRSH